MPATPPPTLDDQQPKDVPQSGKERVLGAIGGVLSAGGGRDKSESPLVQAMDKHHRQRVDLAQKHYKDFQTYTGILATGVNPDTGKPLTAEEAERFYNLREAASGELDKTAGVNKDVKGKLQKLKMIADHIVKLHPKAGSDSAGGAGGGGGAGTTDGKQADAGGGTRMTPPPSPQQASSRQGEMDSLKRNTDASRLRQEMESQHELSQFTAKEAVLHKNKMEEEAANIRENYDFKPDKEGNLLALDKRTGQGKPVMIGGKPATAQARTGAAPKVAMVENVPYGVARDGKIVTPDSPDWTAIDARVFDAAKGASAAGEANKARIAKLHQSYFGSLPQAVLLKRDDPKTGLKAGDLAFVSRQEAGGHPDLYAPPSQGTAAMGATARFGEIQRTVDQVNEAITKLPDTAWDTKSRAQLAYILRSSDPASTLSTFMTSEAAGTLTDAQIQYVTGLVSLVESAQAMTSLQGIGARGSDKLRATITAMLPSGATPSRKYAETQMQRFQTELTALRKGVAGLGPLTEQSGGTKKPRTTPPPKPGDKSEGRTIVIN